MIKELSANSLISAIQEMDTHPSKYDTMVKEALKQRAFLSWDKEEQRLLDLYDTLSRKGRAN